ncbi:MAG: alpha/beta hydrolase [Gammaproteobacteria bacterium]|nr:alpha/beta hydrolase [Gammaproteobacteria bacterium]
MSDVSIESRYVEVPGGHVFVRTWTPRVALCGLPIVLMHDSLGSVELWRDFPAMLAKRLARSVVAYDRLGFGYSSERTELPALSFIREEAEVFFPCIINQLDINAYTLFGHSVGGVMALLVASLSPHQCHAVVSESAQAFVEERTRAGILAAKREFEDPAQFAKLLKRHGRKAQWVLNAWVEIWLSPDFANWRLEPDLESVRCPVLVIHGDQDEYGSVEFPRLISCRVGGAAELAIMAGCGHVPHRERPDDVLTRVARFLEHSVRNCVSLSHDTPFERNTEERL